MDESYVHKQQNGQTTFWVIQIKKNIFILFHFITFSYIIPNLSIYLWTRFLIHFFYPFLPVKQILVLFQASVRGSLNTLVQLFSNSGGLLMYAVGPFVSYSVLHYIILSICVLTLLLVPLLPVSPYYAIMKGDVEGARKSLTWLRGKGSLDLVEKELREIRVRFFSSNLESLLQSSFSNPNSLVEHSDRCMIDELFPNEESCQAKLVFKTWITLFACHMRSL